MSRSQGCRIYLAGRSQGLRIYLLMLVSRSQGWRIYLMMLVSRMDDQPGDACEKVSRLRDLLDD